MNALLDAPIWFWVILISLLAILPVLKYFIRKLDNDLRLRANNLNIRISFLEARLDGQTFDPLSYCQFCRQGGWGS